MKNVLVALWSHRSDWHYGTTATAIMPGLEDGLQHTASVLQVQAVQPSIETQNPFQAIFIAPEYLFVGQRSTQRRAAMRATSKDRVFLALQSLSKAHPRILIVAGTTFWREDLDTGEKQDQYQANLLAAYMKTTNFGKAKKRDAIVLDGVTHPSNGKIIPGLGDLIGKTPKYRAYNTMFGFLGGTLAFKYNKACDYYETDGAKPEKITYLPGLSNGIGEVGNFTFGLEICLDHAANALRGKDADFHLVVSDCTDTRPGQNIGAYLLHASTDHRETGVWKSGNSNRLPTVDNIVPDNNAVNYWLVPIEARP